MAMGESESVSEPKYPTVTVRLSNEDGNSFSILGRCRRAVKRKRLSEEVFKEFHKEATSGDHDHLLQTVFKFFDAK